MIGHTNEVFINRDTNRETLDGLANVDSRCAEPRGVKTGCSEDPKGLADSTKLLVADVNE